MTDNPTADRALLQRLKTAIASGTLTPASRALGATARLRFLIEIGTAAAIVVVERGEVGFIDRLPPLVDRDFSLRGSSLAWQRHWEPMPRPGWHDLLALARFGELRIDGDLHAFMTHLQYLKDLLAMPRAGSAT